MHDGLGVANFILDYADEKGIEITNLSLQKITYFCHVWYLVKTGRPLIRHQFEAWEYGPVLPYLYRAFSKFGDQIITGRATQLDPKTGKQTISKVGMNDDEGRTLRDIIAFYSQLNSGQLVEQSHIPDGPWHKAWYHQSKVNPGMKINNDTILDFYSSHQPGYILQ